MGGIGSLRRKMQRAAKARNKTHPLYGNFGYASGSREVPVERGIYCDCYGTLYSHSFKKDELLVRYLNAIHRRGTKVTLVSSVPRDVLQHIQDIGLHSDIVRSLRDKRDYYRRKVEILIDDDPSMQARTLHHPHNEKFRMQMQNYFGSNAPAPPPA